jgi:flagellar motor switch protein FliM
MQIYKDALNAIADGSLNAVDETSTPNYTTIKELKDAHYVTAIDSSADDGKSFMHIAITLAGRRYQAELNTTA